MSKNQASNRSVSVRGILTAAVIVTLLSLTATAARFSLIDSFKEIIGLKSSAEAIRVDSEKQQLSLKNDIFENKQDNSILAPTADTVILAWDTNGAAGNEATLSPTNVDGNLNTSALSRGTGLASSALSNAYGSTDYTAANSSLSTAVTNNDYVQFTVTPKSNVKASLSTLNANFRRSSSGPNTFQWQFSLNNFSTAGTNVGSLITDNSTATNGDAQTAIDLTGITALQNVASPTVITFRLYGYGSSTVSTGTFAIGRLTGNDLAVTGSVVTQPTSLTYSTNPAVYIKNVAITSNTPTTTGGTPTSYGVIPTLPTGLILNTTSGVISGTPAVTSAATDYTVTATNWFDNSDGQYNY